MITRALLRRDGIWLLLCLIMAWLQFLRGAHAEAAVFAGLPLLLIVDATGGPERLLGDRLPAVSRRLPSRPVLTVSPCWWGSRSPQRRATRPPSPC